MRPRTRLSAIMVLLAGGSLLGGCGSMPSLTTGSLFGGKDEKKAEADVPAKPVAPADTPLNRAFQVGIVSARAVKCGFNFDPGRVKGNYLADEARRGTPVDDMAKVEKVYNVGYNGVAKAVAGNANYCTTKKTKEIKEDLGYLLAGDFTPKPFRPKEEEDEGLLSVGGTKFEFN